MYNILNIALYTINFYIRLGYGISSSRLQKTLYLLSNSFYDEYEILLFDSYCNFENGDVQIPFIQHYFARYKEFTLPELHTIDCYEAGKGIVQKPHYFFFDNPVYNEFIDNTLIELMKYNDWELSQICSKKHILVPYTAKISLNKLSPVY